MHPPSPVLLALVLSLAAAISLGITRFAYGLLLPIMREDLGWSYFLSGAMNTANALGYLAGALSAPLLLRRLGAGRTLLIGAVGGTAFMALTGFFRTTEWLLLQRLLAGVTSAWLFVVGGWLTAQLLTRSDPRGGWLLGLYYGGTGWGIAVSALTVPAVLASGGSWPHAWWALALVCALASAALWPLARARSGFTPGQPGQTSAQPSAQPSAQAGAVGWQTWRHCLPMLSAYGCFGIGYIGYMTFVIALMREQAVSADSRTLFYTALGLAVVASARIWAGLLERFREGQAMALLNALLGLATVMPALTVQTPVLLASGVLFGAVFLSVVASTTAWVRHNLPPHLWAQGITGFTVVFAVGQVVGPSAVGLIADEAAGLASGLLASACVLWMGCAIALLQTRTRV
jgi:predicted MFS family arabinose efflux permease